MQINSSRYVKGNGIDIEKVLKEDPDTLFNMKLKSTLPTPSTADEQTKEIEALRKERDNLADETKGLKASYSSLFKSYEKLRGNYELMHTTRNILADTAEKQKNAMNTIYESALNLKTVMLEQAAVADQTIAETKGRYDSNTVTIRMDLCKLENENGSLKAEIESKNKEIEELRMIIQEVVKQVSIESV
ncbi:Transforming acidic coiled-coil-containing protein 3 [Aphelenchoides bicaudatus]|nr:Transforming acidic coiled-coil-containing protein 3 [Aphelenchoides bicaudatus]